MEITMLIQRCLTYGVKIYPYQLKTIMTQYEDKKVPDEKLAYFNAEQIEKYVKALYLSGQEMSNEWSKGHEMLEELGFGKKIREEGHRSFESLEFLAGQAQELNLGYEH